MDAALQMLENLIRSGKAMRKAKAEYNIKAEYCKSHPSASKDTELKRLKYATQAFDALLGEYEKRVVAAKSQPIF